MNGYSQLLDRVRETARERKLSRKTEDAYFNHIRSFLDFHGECDLSSDRAGKVRLFLINLERRRHASPSTLNQARCALLFFYRDVLGEKMSRRLEGIKRMHEPRRLPTVLSAEEALAVLANMRGTAYLVAALLYGSGLRLAEAVALRVGDLDFERRKIIVRDAATGKRTRATILPTVLIAPLKKHLVGVRYQHEDDCLMGGGEVALPEPVVTKNRDAASEWRWQYLFPARHLVTEAGKNAARASRRIYHPESLHRSGQQGAGR